MAAALLAVPGAAGAAQQKLVASDGAPGDVFGAPVAVDGDTAVVGALADDNGTGSAYVYRRTGNRWAQTAKLTASDGAPDSWFGADVAIDGDTIVVGAPRKDVGGDADQGAVYTFTRTGGDRNETAKLTDSGGNAFDDPGGSVAVDGDTIVAGSQGYNVAAEENHGAVLTFARTGGDRSQTAKLTSSDHTNFGVFGAAVAIDGNTIVVGASEAKPGSGDEAGAAYTFSRAGGARRAAARATTA